MARYIRKLGTTLQAVDIDRLLQEFNYGLGNELSGFIKHTELKHQLHSEEQELMVFMLEFLSQTLSKFRLALFTMLAAADRLTYCMLNGLSISNCDVPLLFHA